MEGGYSPLTVLARTGMLMEKPFSVQVRDFGFEETPWTGERWKLG